MPRVNWITPIETIRPGEPVSADVTNRPIRQVAERVEAVRDRLLDQGSSLVLYEQPADPAVKVGEAVYFDSVENRFRKAIAATQVVGGKIVPAASAEVVGLVSEKVAGGTVNVVQAGLRGDLTPLDESGSVSPADGTYYLSPTIPGRLTTNQPAVPIRVAVYDAAIGTVVAIDKPTSFDQHRHYEFALVSKAAAIENVYVSGGHERLALSDSEASLPGWLPADDPVFDGKAPAGATFGYNLSQHDELRAVWPPAPADATSLTVFLDAYLGGGMEWPREYYTCDNNGIWLKTDIVSQLPWKPLVSAAGSSSSLLPFGDGSGSERRATVYFHKSKYAADRTAVTTLRPADPNGPLRFVDCNGADAVAGDLKAVFDPSATVETNADLSPIGVKSYAAGGKVRRGPVMTGLVPGDASVILESDDVRLVDANEPLGDKAYYGQVTIRTSLDSSERLIQPQLVFLNGVQQGYSSEVYLSLRVKAGVSLTYQFVLPGPVGFPSNSRASLRLSILSSAATSIPGLTVTARRLPRATIPAAVPNSPQGLTFVSPGVIPVGSYQEVETTTSIAVAAADIVSVTVARAPSDGYAGELQFLGATLRLFQGG